MKSSPFQIINAAAGSGKTFALVNAYLQKLLSDQNEEGHRKMLALTFTNKACLLYTSPSPRDATLSRMPSSA